MKRILGVILLVALLTVNIAGCGSKQNPEEGFNIFYLNIDKTKLAGMKYELKADMSDTESACHELLSALAGDSGDVEYKQSIPSGIGYSYSIEGGILTLNFDIAYLDVPLVEDILCRASVVKTLTQLDGVDGVNFLIDSVSMTDSKGNIIGIMTADDFVENPGEQINAIQEANITLYFANSTGEGLVKENRTVYYSTNISMEKLIMEQLIMGPDNIDYLPTIPAETKLVNVSVVDGVCFVSLDESFRNQNYEIQEAVVIYSIVDTLTELDSVSKVQISINGITEGTYRDSFDLSTFYERDLDLLSIE